MTARAVVIGAGIGGLASAALLAAEGYDVTILEALPEPGGRVGSWAADGFRWDTGPSWYLMPEAFDHFFRLLGTSAAEQLELVPLDPGYRVYFEEQAEPWDVRADLAANAALFESAEPGAGRALEAYVASARQTLDLALDRFLYDTYEDLRGLAAPELLRRAPRLLGLLGRPLHSHVARRFRDPRLQRILDYPAVFLGGSPYRVPSMYHLMSALDLTGAVLYPRGGFAAVVERIAALAVERGARLRTRARATEILVRGGRAAGVAYTDAAGAARVAEADLVVGAADLHHLETRLLAPEHRTYPERSWRSREPSPGALLVLLGVRGDLPQLAHHTLLFAEDWRGNFEDVFGDPARVSEAPSLYVCRPSATDPGVAPAGHENLFVLVPIPADPALGRGGVDGAGDRSIEHLADRVIDRIAERAGIPDLADRVVARRTIGPGDFEADLGAWRGNALGLAHTLRQSAFLRTPNVSRRVRGLYYAGSSTLPGVGVPMCLISAELLLKRLRGLRGPGRLPEPLVRVGARP